MIPEKLLEIMKKDGVVAIATLGPDGPHMVNTWNSYLRISQDERPFIPAGYMHKTEANIAHNPDVLITLGSSKVEGLHGAGAGFLIKGKAKFMTSGPDFDFMKEKFSWLRAPWPLQSNQPLKPGEAQLHGFCNPRNKCRSEQELPNQVFQGD